MKKMRILLAVVILSALISASVSIATKEKKADMPDAALVMEYWEGMEGVWGSPAEVISPGIVTIRFLDPGGTPVVFAADQWQAGGIK